MSWLTDKEAIKTALTGYTEIPENKSPEDSSMAHNHKSYSLQLIGLGTTRLTTSNGFTYTHKVRLKVKYLNISPATRDDTAELFISLLESLTGLTRFHNFTTDPVLEDLDNKHSQGLVEFYYGDGGC